MDKPRRILHVLGGLNQGGIEAWLMRVLRRTDSSRFQMDILTHSEELGVYGDEAVALGSRVIPCPRHSVPWVYSRNFRRALTEFGPYDVVHSHVYFYSGFIMHLARRCGIPKRIAHCHNDRADLESNASPARRAYVAAMRHLIARDATVGLAVSRGAARNMFGSKWESDDRWRVVYCGTDLEPFEQDVDTSEVCSELGIPQDAFVIGNVGRFASAKNHGFLLEIAAQAAKRCPELRVLLVGEGPMRGDIENRAAALGILDRIVFAGVRHDVPRLMRAAMDVLVMPSIHEGLPMVPIEAQAANLPCVVSDVLTEEMDVVRPLVHRMSLARPASEWAAEVLRIGQAGSPLDSSQALSAMKASPFDIEFGMRELEAMYES